ncbi:hypothetical protein E5C26_23485 [Serratia proteamaculans]|uniref:hypothetical protein n=1 Tax=Serratia proteamaculans TaxID=28151 RepID=UPI001075DBC2|nr:hypothetical protein [Serratia proteamaculans]TFZ48450.1 hypothetical protein E5C26_23485 [Serratia proteamaculans]
MITIINDSTRRSTAVMVALIMTSLLLSGCAGKNSTGAVAVKKVSQNNPKENTDEQRITLCQQRVNSLKNINPQSYQKRMAYFNGLLSNASGYAGIRSNVDESTRKAIDALYKYKTEKFCADVEYELMSSLSSRVESL